MLRLVAAVFLALHGLVHGWYVVLSQEWITVEDAMGWNGESWVLSGYLPQETILGIASVLYVVVAISFVIGGIGFYLESEWARTVLTVAAIISIAVIVAMWDGRFDQLVEKGAVGVLINVFIIVFLYLK
ncbi:MAG: hypothetical protein ABEI52_03710 [Halobacteriaceae archaeon]